MALAFGQNSTRTSSTASPITTAAITIAVNEKVVVLMLKTVGATDRAGGAPSFGGTTMIQANSTQKAASSPEAGCELWYLVDPPTGSQTASIPNTGVKTIFYTLATAKTSTSSNRTGLLTLDSSNGGNATSTNPTPGAITVSTENAIGFAITAGGWTTWAPSAQVGTAIANTDDGADGGGEQYQVVTTPGSYTLSWTFGTSDDWGAVSAYFREITPPVITNFQFVSASSTNTGILSVTEKIR